MNSLDPDTQSRIIAALVEGVSISSIVRMTGVAKTTILRLVRNVGAACQRFHDARVRCIDARHVQCDEIWSFCYAKENHLPEELRGVEGFGSIWTWTALDADTKLLISWLASTRSYEAAVAFIGDLKSRTPLNRIQLSTDGLPQYLYAVLKNYLPGDIHLGEVVKEFKSSKGQPGSSPNSAESRYSPGRLVTVDKKIRLGEPDRKHISTSFMERWNLTLRMQNRRFTRLTNAFSKKFENHRHMIAMTVVFYNFCKPHKSLGGKTPAMAAGLTDYVWTPSDMLALEMWTGDRAAA